MDRKDPIQYDSVMQVRLTQEQYDRVKKAARGEMMKLHEFLRKVVMQGVERVETGADYHWEGD